MKLNLMKKITFLLFLFFSFSCGVKSTIKMLNSGDYDRAIASATSSLRNNKNAKGKQDYVYVLEEAFAKAKERDLRNVEAWSKENNPANLEKIYNTYLSLHNRQELIRPLLPLKLLKEGRDAIFPMDNYTTEISNSKNALSNYFLVHDKKYN
jgi:hypothetical protein